jgi:hypothetical protein
VKTFPDNPLLEACRCDDKRLIHLRKEAPEELAISHVRVMR